MIGTVKRFNAERGYGFIVPDNGSPDVFFHITALIRAGIAEVKPGDKLQYDLVVDERTKRTRAGTVRLVERALAQANS